MSGRSGAAGRCLVPLGVLGVFAATIAVAVWSVDSEQADPRRSLGTDVARAERGLAETKSDRKTLTRLVERLRAKHAMAARVRSVGEPAPGAAAPAYAAESIHGVVQAVDDKLNVYVVSVGSKDSVRPGTEFEVRRDGELLGTLIADSVFENYVTAKRRPGTRAFGTEPGDDCTTGPSPK
jgi:hypothetical protein